MLSWAESGIVVSAALKPSAMKTSKLPPTAKELYSSANDVFEQYDFPELGLRLGLAAALRALAKLKSQEVKVEKHMSTREPFISVRMPFLSKTF